MSPNGAPVVLTLEVTGPEAQRLGAACRRQFGAEGGTIGRADGNDWVLPHALVSGHHATIQYADGVFYITDTSTNGVFIDSKQNRLPRGHASAIKDGDTIIIEPFHIQISVVAQQPAAAPPAPIREEAPAYRIDSFSDPFRGDVPFVPAAPSPIPSDAPSEELDPLKLLGVASDVPPSHGAPRAQDLEASSPLADHFRPPSPVAPAPRPAALIPDDYDPAAEGQESRSPVAAIASAAPLPLHSPAPAGREIEPRRIEKPRVEPPARPVVPQVRSAVPQPARAKPEASPNLAEMLVAAGLEDAAVTPHLATHLGGILRVVVSGVMDVLRSRQQIKDEFRMRATRFQPADNNPLKFSANVSDALHNLLVKQNPAYLGPVEAFEDAFDDLRNHQLAMLAGMRVAFEAMLAEFDPERLQAQFERRVKKSLIGGGREAQFWEMYRERVRDLTKDVEASFRTLFGDRFVSAYEEQLERLNPPGRDK